MSLPPLFHTAHSYVSAGSRGQMFSDGTFNLLMLVIADCSCSYDRVWHTSVRMTTGNYVLKAFFFFMVVQHVFLC